MSRNLRHMARIIVLSGLINAWMTPVAMAAGAGEAAKSPPISTGPSLSIGIGPCPTKVSGFISPIPVVGALASSAVASLAGAAVDSAVNYLTQERVATTKGLASLGPAELDNLLNKGQCLYAYLYTLDLWRYFNSSTSAPAGGAKPLSLPLTTSDLDEISSKKLTNFMMVLSFVRAGSPPQLATKDSTASDKYLYFQPYIWRLIYPSFVDAKCPAFRDCGKRDVVLSLVMKYPIAPDPSKTENKAFALGRVFQNVSSDSIETSLSYRYAEWFSLNNQAPNLANIELALIETSKPGAVANALAESLKTNKEAIIKVVTP
jgi:hypothetical protein